MDLRKAIQDLYAEKERIERVIASLEELQRTSSALPELARMAGRRGRKDMGAEERLEVSERMKKYWASRRKDQGRDGKPPSGS
jgi:predicted nucleic acid-binding protein